MSYEISGDKAIISGKNGTYGKKTKGADYGKNAAANYSGYIKDFETKGAPLKPDVFTKNSSVEEMTTEIKKLENDKIPPVDFTLQYSPKFNKVKAFFAKFFKGHSIDTKALLGFTSGVMDKQVITIEEADKELNNAFKGDTGAKLSAKAFDVNNDGKIDASEEAASTVIADILSKDEAAFASENTKNALKKADGSYTNSGEDGMLVFLTEHNFENASKAAKEIHQKMGLEKIQTKILKQNS